MKSALLHVFCAWSTRPIINRERVKSRTASHPVLHKKAFRLEYDARFYHSRSGFSLQNAWRHLLRDAFSVTSAQSSFTASTVCLQLAPHPLARIHTHTLTLPPAYISSAIWLLAFTHVADFYMADMISLGLCSQAGKTEDQIPRRHLHSVLIQNYFKHRERSPTPPSAATSLSIFPSQI